MNAMSPTTAQDQIAGRDYLKIAGLWKSYGEFTALKDISLSVGRGEFICFLGPSGCGKTTLLRIIAGLEVQTAGRIELAGRDISALPPAEQRVAKLLLADPRAFTPLLVVWVLGMVSWRTTFVIFAFLGVIWAVFFAMWFRDNPKDNPKVNAAELELLADAQKNLSGGHAKIPWRRLLSTRSVVLLWLAGIAHVVLTLATIARIMLIAARAVVLAMGVEYRELEAAGCTDLTGAGIYYGASTSVAADCDGESVYVVGGANSAGQAAMNLSRYAKEVTIVSRRTLEDSMSHYLIQQIRATGNITELPHTVVHAATGDGHLEGIGLQNVRTGECEEVPCGRMFIFIGAEPRTDWLDGVVARDDHGFILAGPDLRDVLGWTLDRAPHHLETSVPGVFVAGDVRAESAKRVAAAVGEGSMAVMFVHRHLAEA